MIQVHKDELGNITGYFDTERNCWVPPPFTEAEADRNPGDEPPATDADDDNEPEPPYSLEELQDKTKDELKAILEEWSIPYQTSATKADLIALVQQAEAE